MTSYACKSCGKVFELDEVHGGSCPYCGAAAALDAVIEQVTDPAKQAETYEKAVGIKAKAATFGEWETAGKLFASIAGYKDADDMAAACRELAEKARHEAVYSQAKNRQGTSPEALRGKAALMRTVAGYKDADSLAESYEQLAAEMEAESVQARREQQEKQEQDDALSRTKTRRRRRVIIAAAAAAAVVLATVVIVSVWVLPMRQYDQAVEKFLAGDYMGARELFDDIPHYRDSADYLGRINGRMGEEAMKNRDYRGALGYFEQTGGAEDFKAQLEEVLGILYGKAMEEFNAGDFVAAQKDFDEVDKYPGYENARAYKQLCRAIRLWNKEEGVTADKLNLKEAMPAVSRVADGVWYCQATGSEIVLTAPVLGDNVLQWQGYTVEFHSATTLTLTGDGELAGEYEKE